MSGSSSSPETTASAIRGAIDLGRLPWIRPLAGAYAGHFAGVAPLFAGNPADPSAWRDTIARVRSAPHDRAALAAILSRQLTSRGAPAPARAAAATLADAATVAVVTGQQAGVFGGPLYTLLKATTALQLARKTQADTGTPTVAVFWVDADDHDWDEVRTATVLGRDDDVRQLKMRDVPGAGALPVAALTLDDGADELNTALEAVLPATEFTTGVLASVRRHYRPGAKLATAFAGWLDELLGPHGLVVYEAADPAACPLLSDLWVHEIQAPGRTTSLVRAASETMTRLGHRPQVEPADDAVPLFYMDAQGRHAIKRQGGDYAIGQTSRTRAALVEEAQAHPERFSPNVLLRPLAQDRLFPTICYVAGPSELAYQGQLGGVYRAFGIEQPLLFNRATATLLDSASARFLDRSHLPLEALQPQDESALNRLLEAQLPPGIDATLAELDRQMADGVDRLRTSVTTIDPTLGGAVDTTLNRLRDTITTLHNKIIQASKRKDETLRRQFLHTRAITFPGGAPQERALTLIWFVNRYGPAIVERLIEVLPMDTGKHYLIVL